MGIRGITTAFLTKVKMKKRILFLMQLYPPIHGASTVGENIKSSKLINDAFDCDYVRISTLPIGKGGVLNKIKAFIFLYIKVLKLLLKNKYDLVYLAPTALRFPFYKDFGLSILAKLFNKNIVYHFHNKGISVNRIVPPFIMRIFFNNTKVILSSQLLYYDIERYVTREAVFFCAYGIADDIHSLNNINKNPQKPRILFFAHMLRSKGVFVLLNACKILNERNIDFICNFVGSWYDINESEFNSFVKKHNLSSKIIFLGPQYGPKKNFVLANTDIFAFPTYYKDECFPLGLLEALRWGLPIITTKEGAIPDIVNDGICGFLVKHHDSNALAEKLELLIQNKDLREAMGKKGRLRYEQNFTLQHFEHNLITILNKCLLKAFSFLTYMF